MKKYANVNEAFRSLERSKKIVVSLSNDYPYDYQNFGRTILWHLYNICEAALYVCCAHDATVSGTITFPSLKELPKFNKIPTMDIPRDIREAAKKASEYSKPDLENGIDPLELYDAIQAINTFLEWICANTRVEEIKFDLEDLLRNDIFHRIFAL